MVIESRIEVSAEDYYSCDLTKTIPVRVSLVTINGDTGFGIAEPLEGGEVSVKKYIQGLRSSSSILKVEIMFQSKEAYWTRVVHKMSRDSIYETVLKSGCMSRLPIVIQRGVQYHTILAPSQDAFRNLLQTLRSRFDRVRIRRIQSRPGISLASPLTKKQQEAFQLAFDSGYYEIPRKSTIEELCSELNIKRVAMQERLRRAEQRILSEFAETQFISD
ncbi:MAG: helix-turn-helix domain-containing protein [Candidatus Hodarchaeota archaeon]